MDGERWEPVAPLLQRTKPGPDGWIAWSFINYAPYRSYKLVFLENLDKRHRQAVSIAGLVLLP
jgi:hypothetical protein